MAKSRSPLCTIWPSWNSIAVRVPPTCARSSTLSTAENWPRKRPVACTVCCNGRLTVTCGAGGGGASGCRSASQARPAATATSAATMPATPRARHRLRRRTGRRLSRATRVRSATSWSVKEMLSMSDRQSVILLMLRWPLGGGRNSLVGTRRLWSDSGALRVLADTRPLRSRQRELPRCRIRSALYDPRDR